MFGKVGLYLTKNGIMFLRTALVDYSRFSTFSIWFRMMLLCTLSLLIVYQCDLNTFCIHQKFSKHVLFLILDCEEYAFLEKEDF